MENYKSNSHRSKETPDKEKQRVEKIVSGKVRTKKKSELRKLTDIFVPEDVDDIKSYIFMDVIIPAIKKIVLDIVETSLYGATGRTRKNSGASKVSYQRYYDRQNDARDRSSVRTRSGYSYNDVIFDSYGEADDVLTRMDELIDTYGLVRVADLYDMAGITGNYTDNNYGWTNIRSANIVRTRDGGYMIKLPKALPLD